MIDTHPDAVDNFLAWGAFDEASCLAYYGHLDCISNAFLEIVIAFLPCHLDYMRVST
jgi:hypothetical protein